MRHCAVQPGWGAQARQVIAEDYLTIQRHHGRPGGCAVKRRGGRSWKRRGTPLAPRAFPDAALRGRQSTAQTYLRCTRADSCGLAARRSSRTEIVPGWHYEGRRDWTRLRARCEGRSVEKVYLLSTPRLSSRCASAYDVDGCRRLGTFVVTAKMQRRAPAHPCAFFTWPW
jgi:hypothetical protein